MGDWRTNAAIAGGVMLGIACALAFSHWVTVAHLPSRPSSAEPDTGRHYHQTQAAKRPVESESEKRGAYDAGYPYPQNREDADLCEQRSMAQAAKETVALADAQYRWNITQVAATIVAAFATAWAAWAATIAARAAVAATHSERAWMTHDGIDDYRSANAVIEGVNHAIGYFVELRWSNTGRSPAVRTHAYVDHQIVEAGSPIPHFAAAAPTEDRFGVIGPGVKISTNAKAVSGEQFDRIQHGELVWYFYSKVTYETALEAGKTHHSEACGRIMYKGNRVDSDGTTFPMVSLTLVGPQNTAT